MSASSKKILVVEDDSTLRDILNDSLTNEGYNVLQAQDAAEGLKLALSKQPELILLDILLPDQDGLTVLKKIRTDEPWGKAVKVIMLTNLSDKQSVAAALEQGASSFLVKSDWKIQDVIETIHNELRDWPT